MAQNYPKWTKYDARIYALFLHFFFTEKAVPQTFSLLECMIHSRSFVLFCPNIFNAIEHHFLILAGRWILRMKMYEMEREKKVLKIG